MVDESAAPAGIVDISINDFSPVYYICAHSYPVGVIGVEEINDVTLGPTAANPKGVYYRDGHLKLGGNVTVNGTLVVRDDLSSISGFNSIKSSKNFPAVIVGHRLKMEYDGKLEVEGLVWVKDKVEFINVVDAHLMVTGCLFIRDHNVDGMVAGISSLTAISSADNAAIEIWRSDGTIVRWSPAESAFYKSIAKL
ncbi:MAG: hypothetical protein ACYSSI_11665 [Planctomycetota bacterium]